MASLLQPVSREQAFLETYFQCLSKCAYDKAKDSCEKERESCKNQMGTLWCTLVSALLNLTLAEKAYSSLIFLGQNLSTKIFGQKKSLKLSYDYLLRDLRRIEENSTHQMAVRAASEGGVEETEQLLGHLCGQLSDFITARAKLLDFYEQLYIMSQTRPMVYEDLLSVVQEVIHSHQSSFHHPILVPLKSSFSLECDILSQLLQAQLQLEICQFLPSLLHLHDSHIKLNTWGATILAKDVKKHTFSSSSKTPPMTQLYQWLSKYKGLLVSKFSLYFFETLSKQAPGTEVKSLMAKATVDFYGKIITYQRKSDATCVLLVMDVNGMKVPYKGPGYHHPSSSVEPPKGLDSYPAIFAHPPEKCHEKHMPAVVSIMNDQFQEPRSWEKTVYFYDEKIQSTYFMSRIDPRITLVIIFECKKSERDTYTNNFVNDVCSQLRCTKLFSVLNK